MANLTAAKLAEERSDVSGMARPKSSPSSHAYPTATVVLRATRVENYRQIRVLLGLFIRLRRVISLSPAAPNISCICRQLQSCHPRALSMIHDDHRPQLRRGGPVSGLRAGPCAIHDLISLAIDNERDHR